MLEQLERYITADQGYAELRLHRNLSRRVVMRRGSLIENSTSTLAGSAARCHKLGTFGFASVPAVDGAALDHVLIEARHNAALMGQRAGYSDRPLPAAAPGQGVHDYSTKRTKMTAAVRIDLLRQIDDYVRTRFPDVINADIVLTETAIEKALATSEGARSYCFSPRVALYVMLSVDGPDGAVQLYD